MQQAARLVKGVPSGKQATLVNGNPSGKQATSEETS